ncbi:MAG: hypothetical protein ACYC3F_17195 [Gemmatimonadaceae bacterium]
MNELKTFKESMKERFDEAVTKEDYKTISNICHGAFLVSIAFTSLSIADEIRAMRDKATDKYHELIGLKK